ncbi:MAG TPA: aspartate aminotransferase family protein [Oceanospirillaceae bacterium]|nr:aspartate aminotransferase family protein [Oceanospirillaceae bacterium]
MPKHTSSHVFHRHCHGEKPTAVGGNGCYITDHTGKQYLDGSGGAAVSCLGHGDTDVTQAMKAQLDQIAFAHTGFFTSEAAEQLADLLVEHAPGNLDRVYLVSGGSEAVEAALKLARQFFIEVGQPQRTHVIARRQSYHGNTLGALATGGNQWRREPFLPLLVEVSHIAPCYAYRDQQQGETELDYGLRVANELEQEILNLGADKVMAFVAEPVVGATMGAVPAVAGYFKRIRQICDQYGVLLIFDEVMCGMGRTGQLFACEDDEVVPDLLVMAKGLGAGYQPIGAMLASTHVYEAIAQGSGFFQHGHTYMGHPVACAAALAVTRKIVHQGLLQQVVLRGQYLTQALNKAFGDHPKVGDIRGRGLFQGLELVADRASKQPLSPRLGIANKIKQAAFQAGLICYPMAGTVDGVYGDHVLLAPPFIISEVQIDELVTKLSLALGEVLPT